MIYCVGNRFHYEQAFAAGPVVKQGRGVGADGRLYPGGWVWRTVAEAERFITANGLNATHRVYGVLADWDRDAVASAGEETRRLRRNAEIVRLTE
jgi:hypothetical protein